MLTLIYFASINKMTVIEWIFQDIFYLVLTVWLASASFNATLKKIIRNILKSALSFCV